MKFLYCPKCGIRRFQVKKEEGGALLVNVNHAFDILPVREVDSIEGFNLDVLYCLGCSWEGSKEQLRKLPPI